MTTLTADEKRAAKNAKRREARAAKKVADAKAAEAAAKVEAGKTPSKKSLTVAIYAEVMKAKGVRKDGVARLTSELGLSAACASTYWQNCKSGRWS